MNCSPKPHEASNRAFGQRLIDFDPGRRRSSLRIDGGRAPVQRFSGIGPVAVRHEFMVRSDPAGCSRRPTLPRLGLVFRFSGKIDQCDATFEACWNDSGTCFSDRFFPFLDQSRLMPSVREIAESVNVSIGSVSRVLNNQPHVSPELRAKVLKAVNELRDDSAVGSPGVTTSIAFAYRGQSFLSPYDAALLHGIAEGLAPTEHDLMVVNTARGRGLGGSLGQTLIRRGVAGVVFRAATKDHGLFSELATERFPTVVIAERIESEHIGCVHFDAELAIAQALSHLVQQGHRKIAIALNAIDDYDHAQRFAAYQHFLAKHDLPTDDRWIIRSPGWDSNGGSALRKLMALPDRPTAIFMTDPGLGSGLCIEALRMGVRIPQDLSVIGFDDSEGRYDTFPRLSSVCQHVGLLGETALQHLLDVIARRSAPREIKLECSFEPLDSTAAPFSDL